MSDRPNVVFVITDDQGYGDLGCTGNPIIRTPHLDRFYAESVRFTNFHVGPTCAPTRAGLMTGHYANSTGVWHTIGGRSLLRKEEWTIADALRDNGYRTGIFGKWHLGDAEPYRPQDRGFDTTVVHGGGGISQTPDYWGNDYFDDTYLVNGKPKRFEGYCTDVFFREALRFIAEHRDEPFFCYIATNAPHVPYNVEDRHADPYRDKVPEARARFYGMIGNIDENFGRLRARLEAWGLAHNTILVFMTDNGSSGGATTDAHGFVKEGYNAGLRGLKNSPYDGGHRVPFFIRWPAGRIRDGRDIGRIAANVDFMPTVLDLCGIAVPEERTFHGQSLTPLLYGADEPWPDRTMVTDSQRLVQPVKWRQSAVMTDRWRLINGKELYEITADREQRSDVAGSYPDVVGRLRSEYEKWWELVSVKFDEEIPISIGTAAGDATCLTCHEWRNEHCELPYNQRMIREGMEANGYWELCIEQSGTYRFEVRRWPEEAARPLTSGIEGDDVIWSKEYIQEKDWLLYTGGRALPITQAGLKIDNTAYVQQVEPDQEFALFTLKLEQGPARLETWFTDQERFTVGGYYVRAVRTED